MTNYTLEFTMPSMKEDNDVEMTVGNDRDGTEHEQQHHQQVERPPPRLMITKMVGADNIVLSVRVFGPSRRIPLHTVSLPETLFCVSFSTSGPRKF
jgi:hypothetical protein